MQLDEFTKSKCKWHLGYNQTSIPAGDLARLEEAHDNVQDSFREENRYDRNYK